MPVELAALGTSRGELESFRGAAVLRFRRAVTSRRRMVTDQAGRHLPRPPLSVTPLASGGRSAFRDRPPRPVPF
jgi:hypothetical protein